MTAYKPGKQYRDWQEVYRPVCELENEPFDNSIFRQVFQENVTRSDCFYASQQTGIQPPGFSACISGNYCVIAEQWVKSGSFI